MTGKILSYKIGFMFGPPIYQAECLECGSQSIRGDSEEESASNIRHRPGCSLEEYADRLARAEKSVDAAWERFK